MKKIILASVAGLLFMWAVSCKSKTYYTYENTVGIPPAEFAMMDTVNYTSIEMENTDIDFGTINRGDSVTLEFKFKNTGDNTLFFSLVYPSCGCTVPKSSTPPTKPGEAGVLTAVYHSREDKGAVHKSIKVHTNTANGIERILTFHGNVNTP